MKKGHIILVFLLGTFLTFLGALFKLQHWPYGTFFLNIGLIVQIIAAVMVVIKLFKKAKNKKVK
ncbi:MAG: hypothetical protein BM557_01510 [Flavobacterium sp. MedPE-SWcel]|uniref:GldL-related protein n=1 Tax=uncultured Flavobacterium sp. TaxID=165435 RepID=UPI00091DD28E|nr:gliding motility protein GldL [uncultured Flavobacterium sp.]OIQ22082.1 MAG: hypothetical protein BM557_01510 [Flavobacterium sp. MedPE-SWcel]